MKVLGIFLGFLIISCAPTGGLEQENSASRGLNNEELEERNNECTLYNSFASANMQNRDYSSAVDNFKYMLKYNL